MIDPPNFRPPTDHYDPRVESIDDKIVALIAKRQAVSAGHPGFPRADLLDGWANQHALPISILQHIFGVLHRWPVPVEPIEPEQYRRFIPLLRAKTHGEFHIFIPYVRQYRNCSLVLVELEGKIGGRGRLDISLILDGYSSRYHGGRGDRYAADHVFLVTPPISDAAIDTLTMAVEFKSSPVPRHLISEDALIPLTRVTLEP